MFQQLQHSNFSFVCMCVRERELIIQLLVVQAFMVLTLQKKFFFTFGHKHQVQAFNFLFPHPIMDSIHICEWDHNEPLDLCQLALTGVIFNQGEEN